MDGYIVKRVGSVQNPPAVSEQSARRALADRMSSFQKPKFNLRYPPKDDTWGPDRTQPEAVDLAFKNTKNIGDKAHIRGSVSSDAIFALIHVFRSLGSDVIKVALDQLGDPYVWDHAGPGSFDCSGLVIFCYQKVNCFFPLHTAAAIMADSRVQHFSDKSKVRDGDLIGYRVHSLYDHIGIACWHDGELWVIDASSSADQVVFRPADSNPIVDFGYVYDVTGPH
jgi:cell wall-associated NlpC family hydrolase